jgi:hypothetical protein
MSYATKIYKDADGDRLNVAAGAVVNFASGSIPVGVLLNKRTRATTAEVNAGLTLLPALSGYKYRLVDVTMIAIGGNAATATSVDIVTTQAASAVRPIVAAVAALTRSAVVKPNSANVTVLADGASFVANDANTAVSVSKQAAGSNLATATHIDVILSYVIEAA